MGEIRKAVFIKNAVETLGCFSEQMAAELRRIGFETYLIDYEELYASLDGVERFAGGDVTALVTFNFIGFSGEEVFLDASGVSLWERLDMRVCNVLVDHPMYYHRQLTGCAGRMTVFCVDRGHVRYVQRFYPDVRVRFLPLAGNMCGREMEQERPRRYGVVFTANYVPSGTFEKKMTELGPEYEVFYRGILEDLMDAPEQGMDEVMERHLRAELGAVSEAELREALYGMRWLDLYARTLLRGEVVRRLAEADIPVHVFGAGWEELACEKPQNLVRESGQIDSAACVEAVRQARIALNVLPWFRDGAHDRIFTAMLQGTLALTDASGYLREEFADGEDLVFFSLQSPDRLPELVRDLLAEPERIARIAARGQEKASLRHTWAARAREIAAELDTDLL